MPRTRLSITVAATAAVFLIAGLAGAGAAFQAEPTAVAVVNMERVFDSLDERTQIEAQMRSRQEQLSRERDRRRQEVQQLSQDIEVLNPDSDAYRQKESELRERLAEFRVWAEMEEQQLNIDRGLHLESLYRRTVNAIGEIADEMGYDIVLYKEGPLELQGSDPGEIQTQIAIRKVLHASDEVDITDRVVQTMNNQFEARQ